MDYSISFISFPLFNWESDHACLTVCTVHKQYSYSLTKARQNDQKTSQAQPLMAKKVFFTAFWEHGGLQVSKRAAWRSQACSDI